MPTPIFTYILVAIHSLRSNINKEAAGLKVYTFSCRGRNLLFDHISASKIQTKPQHKYYLSYYYHNYLGNTESESCYILENVMNILPPQKNLPLQKKNN